MSKKALAGIIIGCTIAIIVAIVLTRPPNGSNGHTTNDLSPASFTVADLRIDPAEIGPAQATNLTVRVTNVGNLAGNYQAVFSIDNVVLETVPVYLVGGETRDITCTIPAGYSPGPHSVGVSDLSDIFTVAETLTQGPLNVRIDYFAIKDAMGEDDYEDPLYGEIQLIIVVTDGQNEPQTCYLPQVRSGDSEGFRIPDFGRRQLDQSAYHANPAGHYLKVSILAYDLDSLDNLLTQAKILEALAGAVGVPGADILRLLISLLPYDNERVGECQAVWYPEQSYGIGQHQLTCLDGNGHPNMFVGLSIWSDEEPPLLPVPSPFPGVPENQTRRDRMSPNVLTCSYLKYRRELLAGEKVDGHLRLTGDIPPYLENDPTCCFYVYDPDGNEIDSYRWCEDFKRGGLYHDFAFTATRHGVYTIKVGHCSTYARDLDMVISPHGWQ